MDRREFLGRCAIVSGGAVLFGGGESVVYGDESQRPNILWIIAEDICPDIGCYGNGIVKTPNIDRLASEGARYTNAFVTCPVCSPSRSAFMTGMYQTTIGAHQHRTNDKKELPGDVKLLPEYFRKAGYYTSSCGYTEKWDRRGKTDLNFKIDKPFDGIDWRGRRGGQPFFSLVQFSETHRDFKRDPSRPIDPKDVNLPPYYPDHPVTRRDWADYLECVQVLDKKVGKVLERLEEDGLAGNTVVFFFGDNGRPHVRGKQFLYEGGIHVPLIVRRPGKIKAGSVIDDLISLIDLGPTSLKLAGVDCPAHMQGRAFLGDDVVKRDYIFAARDRCDETYERIRCVRNKRFKYIRNYFPNLAYTQCNLYKERQYAVWTLMKILYAEGKLNKEQAQFMASRKPVEELYDLVSDPHEINNLAEKEEYATVLQELRDVLDEWIKETKDKGEVPEDPNIAAKCYREIHKPWHERVMKKRGLPNDIGLVEYMEYWKKQLGI